MQDKYDIVIIGSGIGGLVSAALLSDLGKKILIIEKEPKPGGYLNEFKMGDFRFDVSMHLLNGCSQGQYVYNMFKRCGIIDDIKFVKPKYLHRTIFPDLDLKIPQTNLDGYKEILAENFPEEQRGVNTFFKNMAKLFHEVNNYGNHAPLTSSLSLYLKNDAETILNKYISDLKLKAIISQLWMYFGLPPSKLRAVDFCYPLFDYIFNGGYYLEHGSFEIARLLVNHLKSHGVEFIFNKTVDTILVGDNGCEGIKTGRDKIMCDAVISNIDLRKTIFDLVGHEKFRPESIKKLETIEPSISAVEVFLGLDIDLKDIYPDEYEIFVNSGYDIDEQYEHSISNKADRAPFAIGIYSNVNKFAAPKGKSAITIVMLSGYDYWNCESKKEYEERKERVSSILIKRASKIIPEIASHIQNKSVSTPLTFERYTNNSKGAIYGYTRTLNGKIEIRPNEISEVKGLYFASAWARQGSGVLKVLRSANDVYEKIMNVENVESCKA